MYVSSVKQITDTAITIQSSIDERYWMKTDLLFCAADKISMLWNQSEDKYIDVPHDTGLRLIRSDQILSLEFFFLHYLIDQCQYENSRKIF